MVLSSFVEQIWMARHDKSDFKTINKIERYFICHDTNDIQWYFWPFTLSVWACWRNVVNPQKVPQTFWVPQTHHVEAVALLSKLDVDNHIKLEIGEEDIESLSIKKNATYPEIKDYVLKKYGFKVSSLYIAQVKR